MKKWFWLALLALVVVSGSRFFPQHPPVMVSLAESNTDVAVSRQPLSPPVVYPHQLMEHVKALNFKRYTSAERTRTRTYLTQSLKKLGWSPKLQSFESGVNVFATRPGTDPKAGAVLIAAHYDTVAVSPGADDNATGVAVVLEVARLLASRPTPRTLQLMFFDREEAGLIGSNAFTANKNNLDQLRGVIVLDMVGYACYTPGCQQYPAGMPITSSTNKGNFLAVIGDSEHLPLLDAFKKSEQPSLPPVLTLPVSFNEMLSPDLLRSDHAPFWSQGVGAVLVTDTANLRTPHYHQPSDLPATLDKSFFTSSAQIVVNALTELLVNLEQPPS